MCNLNPFSWFSHTQNRQNLIDQQTTATDQLAAEEARQRVLREEAAKNERIRQGQSGIDSAFGQFNDDYFNNYKKAYSDNYRPGLDEQFGEAQRKLGYNLARKGQNQSSNAARLFGQLNNRYDDELLGVEGQGNLSASQLRAKMEAARSGLYAENRAVADPSSIANRATAEATALNERPVYQPLGDVFSSFLTPASQFIQQDSLRMNPQFRSPTVFGGSGGGSSGSGRLVA